ncbi:MAG: ribokinase, partial [Ktedonobacterales bacterium]
MARPAQPGIVVVGSVNMDVVSAVAAFPQPGETVTASATTFHPGGKGANQAVAAAAAGASVDFIGALGDDAFAEPLAAGLAAHGVGVAALARKPTTSGQAFITVNAAGQNTIILSAGANGQVTAAEVEAQRPCIAQASALLTKREIPWGATLAALRLAHEAGARSIHNPAPAAPLPGAAWPLIETLILNETEAATLTGQPVASLADASLAALALLGRGVRVVIVTLGALGSLYLDAAGRHIETPIFPVAIVDTTGAGDTFIGMY